MSFVIDQKAMDAMFLEAHSANAYTDYQVTDQELAEVWDLIKWGPTAMNNQPMRMFTVRPGEAQDALVEAAMDTNKAKVKSANLNLILAADLDFHTYLPSQHPHGEGFAPVLEANAPMRQDWAISNAWLQAGYLVAGLRAHGLAVGPMLGFDFDKIKATLMPSERYLPFMVTGVGHPDVEAYYPRGPRLDASSVILPAGK
ncbi:malonic semialdehyde reductase [Stomatohabitans albus]|uniref:malonic semialdehyde reductase n=1 Tax=Stomatohabitans albus TaxID=3110766 RepID=UPI00300C29CA